MDHQPTTRLCDVCGRPFVVPHGLGARKLRCSRACVMEHGRRYAREYEQRTGYQAMRQHTLWRRKGCRLGALADPAMEHHVALPNWQDDWTLERAGFAQKVGV